MNAGTINLRGTDGQDTDGSSSQTVIGEMGYQYHLAPNEHKTLADNAENRTLAANATVKFGSTTQQSVAPEILADVDDNVGIT